MLRAKMLFAGVVLLTSSLHADIPLLTTGPGRLVSVNGTRGYSFDVAHELTVTGLAKFDANENGVLDDVTPPQVGVWNTLTTDLLASAVIDDGAELRDGMFVKPITPIVLPPGNYTLGTEFFPREEPSIALSETQSPAGMSPPTALRARGRGLTIPSATRSTLQLTLGPNLVVEQPPIVLTEPYGGLIAQRQDDGMGTIRIAGFLDEALADSAQIRAVPMDSSEAAVPTSWQTVPTSDGHFSADFELPGGWYRLEARGMKGNEMTSRTSSPRPVGVGEVFVIAGQSNSANDGLPVLTPEDERVLGLDAVGNWGHAADPQPRATGTGGSPWPVFGDLLAAQLDVPIGIVSVGWGGTTVKQWLPNADGPDTAPLYNRLRSALETLGPDGARAVLWHQGETDALEETDRSTYAQRLSLLIEHARTDAGFDIPWGVAQAAFQPQNPADAIPVILDAQRDVIRDDPLVFAGPNTDLLGLDLRYDDIHFNEEGLRQHAALWVDAVQPLFTVDEFLAADFDEDGIVDDADFLFLVDAFGSIVPSAGTDPDLDGSGIVDFADFLVLSVTHGESMGTIVAVPEPTISPWCMVVGTLPGFLRHEKRLHQ